MAFSCFVTGERLEWPRCDYVIRADLALGSHRNEVPFHSGTLSGPMIFEFCPHNNTVVIPFLTLLTPHYAPTNLSNHHVYTSADDCLYRVFFLKYPPNRQNVTTITWTPAWSRPAFKRLSRRGKLHIRLDIKVKYVSPEAFYQMIKSPAYVQ